VAGTVARADVSGSDAGFRDGNDVGEEDAIAKQACGCRAVVDNEQSGQSAAR